MNIKKITSRSGRDFYAIYKCKHCNYEEESAGYSDENFHENIIPNWKCPKCRKTELED